MLASSSESAFSDSSFKAGNLDVFTDDGEKSITGMSSSDVLLWEDTGTFPTRSKFFDDFSCFFGSGSIMGISSFFSVFISPFLSVSSFFSAGGSALFDSSFVSSFFIVSVATSAVGLTDVLSSGEAVVGGDSVLAEAFKSVTGADWVIRTYPPKEDVPPTGFLSRSTL